MTTHTQQPTPLEQALRSAIAEFVYAGQYAAAMAVLEHVVDVEANQ